MALFEHGNECVCSYTICVVLIVIALVISIGIGAYFVYKYMNRNKEFVSRENYVYQAKNYWYKWEIPNKLTLKIEHITFFNDMINIKDFDSSLLKIDKRSYKNIGIYNIGYVTIKKIDDYENIYSVNPLYLMIGKVIGHIEEKLETNI